MRVNQCLPTLAATLLSLVVSSGTLAQNLVSNGSFEQVVNSTTNASLPNTTNYIISSGRDDYAYTKDTGAIITNWVNRSGVGVVYGAGISDDPNHTPIYAKNGNPQAAWYLRGPANGVINGLQASSPEGGNFFGADANFVQGTLTQTVGGLVVGQDYTLSFYWAGAILGTYGGGTQTAGWNVNLGNGSTNDVNASVSSTGYNGNSVYPWEQKIINFKAGAATEVLTFTPTGTGSPPMALLDGVAIYAGTNVTAVPEPATWALMIGGLGLLAAWHRRQTR